MDLPPKGVPEFQHWLKHKETYGSISSITVMGQTLVIIHDRQAVHDLMEKKSSKTSARPKTEFASKLCGMGEFLTMQQYDSKFRRGRGFMHQEFGTRVAASRFGDLQEEEVGRFLLRVLSEPENVIEHIKAEAGAIMLKMTYGYSIEPKKTDPLVDLIHRVMATVLLAITPTPWLVDVIPAVKLVPDGFPGTGYKETARKWNKMTQAVAEIPYAFVRQQIASGNHRESYVSKLVQQSSDGDKKEPDSSCDSEHIIKWTAATLYAAGAETMVTSLTNFILAMVMFPDVQRKAQEEIDRVTGTNRLPEFQDRVNLPYIEGLVKEVHRWSPAIPLGMPHITEEDIIYKDYVIPKGAYLFAAIWWFLHDPEVYADPSSFNPERYLEPSKEPDPMNIAFGYGRRICPGRYFADSVIFLTIAQTLAAFNISKAVDEQGLEIDVELKATPGLATHVEDFPYKITPRNPKQVELIRAITIEHPWEESDASLLRGATIEAFSDVLY
ncbi:hypothetical protein G7Z17_g3701 [Cylindrodendrum hubeiense]|uniref:Cytochrome P450 n=1 Tax=Cylindrodendrum hubeiense TaxID=595255 RepID=A0A9P5HKL3_9HYPO|nr:hypothetical protein G7Z17_g3701 [Cylindrodendrum hubeiense]